MVKFTRREALCLAGGSWMTSIDLEASTGDFWNTKPPSEWSAEEAGRLLNKSPWAKEVTASYAGDGRQGGGYPGGGGGYPGGMGGPRIGIGGLGLPMPRGRMGGGRGRGGAAPAAYKGVIRWESAQPIREADKTPLPDSLKDHYVISVSGIPMNTGRRLQEDDGDSSQPQQDRFEALKQFTILQPKGKELAQAGVVEQQGGTFLFGFSKDSLQLSADDKEFDFSTRMGNLAVKAKFDAKEMVYHRRLAV
jgi:hypothetical protein